MRNRTGAIANTCMGRAALYSNTMGNSNTACGASALFANTTGSENVAIGINALYPNTVGFDNTAIGTNALRYKIDGSDNTSFNYCTGLGVNSKVSASNQIQLGGSGTTTYAYGSIQDRSDLRDKADIRDTILGLDFINCLRPVDFKWDMRNDYFENTKILDDNGNFIDKLVKIPKNGSKKRNRYHHGLIAQEVKKVIDEKGIDFGGFQDHSLIGGSDVLSLGYMELVAPLIKAIQEIDAKIQYLNTKIGI